MSKQSYKKEKKRQILIIILLIVIIILLLLSFLFMYNTKLKMIPGNEKPDIYDISIGRYCKDDDVKKTLPVFNQQKDENVLDKVFVDDVNGNYIYQQSLKIFNNKYFNGENKIAPGVSSTYNFKVHNSSNVKVKYRFNMFEISDYSINLKYRLKKNDEYVIGNKNNWVSASDLIVNNTMLNGNSNDSYSLDWKWDYDGGVDNEDTIVGENMKNLYKLNIRFYFEQD